jgi:hypothetical protein
MAIAPGRTQTKTRRPTPSVDARKGSLVGANAQPVERSSISSRYRRVKTPICDEPSSEFNSVAAGPDVLHAVCENCQSVDPMTGNEKVLASDVTFGSAADIPPSP